LIDGNGIGQGRRFTRSLPDVPALTAEYRTELQVFTSKIVIPTVMTDISKQYVGDRNANTAFALDDQ